jgi:Caspase domain
MAGRRSALIVANDEYQDASLGRLRAPARDAEALARVLRDPAVGAFEVEVISNQPEWRLRRAIGSFFTDRSRDDLLLLHFSCHGVKDDAGQLYFATADTELANLDATAVPADFVNRHMTRSLSRRVVLLLDCCYSGAFARGMLARAGTGVELRERFEGRGRIVLTASSAMEYAFEAAELARDDGQPSVFTRALVRGLETGEADGNGDGRVSVDELYDYVYEQVRSQTPKQTPGRWNFEVAGDLLIARSPSLRPVELPGELQQAVQHPIARVRLGAVEELAQLLGGGHAGLALAARATLERLAADDSHLVSSKVGTVLAARPAPPAGPPPAPPPPATTPAAPPAPVATSPATPAPAAPRRAAAAPRMRPAAAQPRTRPAAVQPRPRPAVAARPRRPPRRLLVAAVPVVVALLALAVLTLREGGRSVAVGQPFSATSPWRLQVKGDRCGVTVAGVDYGQPERRAFGADYSLQMRRTGQFVVTELTSGCSAAVLAGSGDRASLPMAVRGDADGAGGDSRPFRSTGAFTVVVSGPSCRTTVRDATDGSEVAQFDGTEGVTVTRAGEFYLSPTWGCAATVSSGDRQAAPE